MDRYDEHERAARMHDIRQPELAPTQPAAAGACAMPRVLGGLVPGALAFGAGWGLAGYCPGPALASLATGGAKPLVFVLAMLAGMTVYALLERASATPATPDGETGLH